MNNIPTHLSPTRQFYKAVALALAVTAIVVLAWWRGYSMLAN
jgi:hypothetical protein